MFHTFEVNGSGVILQSEEEALRVIKGNPTRVIAADQTTRWEKWATDLLKEQGLYEHSLVEGRFDPDAARVVLATRLMLMGEAKGNV
jgi:hypothetical protein